MFTSRRRRFGLLAASAVAVTAVVGTTAVSEAAPRSEVQHSLDALVQGPSFPGAIATVRDRAGKVRTYTAGPVPRASRVRIGSNTKTFTSVVVLQLVGEGKVGLDQPVEKYLPGMVRGDGIDGHKITVRQLLQHTSGIPDYDEIFGSGDYLPFQHTYWEPRQMVDEGLRKKALFPPGTSWEYSNTNYILAGLIIQKVTGRPVGEEITRRIIEPLGLRDTYWPAAGDQRILGPHPKVYYKTTPDGPATDVTELDPSMGWAAGQMIATPGDLNRFFSAVINGKLLKPAQLREMLRTVHAPDMDVDGDGEYGLGISKFPLSCGGFAWGHGGDIPGFETRNAVTPDGREAALAVTAMPTTIDDARRVTKSLDTALCS
ncbi:serine hydrolase domain-containing protein [Kribbella albertanoniae]|uniref:Class A beta-lactamase-related serine hydrolase n=1 Tax=Kribbella albertanoniae TaxID=1266829 RepID=A0A4R4Q0X6_9ACTN|nr:serine hydrolase domain-containing protein [Kribbella albertanoniae]TDC28564.1 class A beta-lactamase-related serine hydrolase [Kribbella albertanoniae]